MPRVALVGLWHLGCVVSNSLAQLGHTVAATDPDSQLLDGLRRGKPPLFEPGLEQSIATETAAGRLRFVDRLAEALDGADYAFITFDTPVDENDQSDLRPIEAAVDEIAREGNGLQVVIMSQVPVGTCRRLTERLRSLGAGRSWSLVYQPENLRLGTAFQAFLQPDMIVAGGEQPADGERLMALYESLQTSRVITNWESAEMVKHALNSFLATSISFINEISDLAEAGHADIRDVVSALRLDRRIGENAFLSPGLGFSGGTLARDVQTLRALGLESGQLTRQLNATLEVNGARLEGVVAKLKSLCGDPRGLRVALLGLTYKPGTSTLRRSRSLELARLLMDHGASVAAFDPRVTAASEETQGIQVCPDAYAAAAGADAVLVITQWPEFRELDLPRLRGAMKRPVLIDPQNHLDDRRAREAGFVYSGTGIAAGTAARGHQT